MGYISKILNFVGYRCVNAAFKLGNNSRYPKSEEARYKKEDPSDMKRVTYPLDENSIVVDVGGLTGDWASRIYCKYSCCIDIYEPHPILSDIAKLNFVTNPKVIVYQFGLSNENKKMKLYGNSVDASLHKNNSVDVNIVDIRKASEVFKKYNHIDLLKLNIEGAEYEVLPDLIENFDMTKIDNIQIQFHRNVNGYEEKRNAIRIGLATTHRMEWNYDYIFENWVKV